ncbi:MAG: hypothetical protein DRJ97_03015 [Thermoprotei archaeon]|nr:MAG: hypothetical protein DRJ97_03015 [Thermoprotei archaeon]
MEERAAVLKLGLKDALYIACLAIILIPLALVQGRYMAVYKGLQGFELNFLFFTLLWLALTLLHEALHLATMKALGVRSFKLRALKAFKVPVALMVVYDEMSIKQYLVTVLSPQALTVVLLTLSVAFNVYVDLPWAYRGPLWFLFYLLYALHLAGSAGDLYGFLHTLVKAKTLNGRLKCIVEEGKLKEIHVYATRRCTSHSF